MGAGAVLVLSKVVGAARLAVVVAGLLMLPFPERGQLGAKVAMV
jgi:hypothetical protein